MRILFFIVFSFMFFFSYSQNTYTISGYIEDNENGESLFGVNVYSPESNAGVISNSYGFYSLSLERGEVFVEFSIIGYNKKIYKLDLNKDTTINVSLELSSVSIKDILVTGEATIVEKTRTSVIDIPVRQIKKIPALLGEVDILKSIQLLPGVQSGNEGSSGFYVRGGGPDQNLILLDGVPVYNASHLFGFFSVFNADAVKNVRLTKGGFPARFGGRLSSVLEIDMKEGNMKKFAGDFSVGLIASKFTFEGPLSKDKTSFIVSGRRTYADLLIKPFTPRDENGGYYFYDFNFKINHKLSQKDRLYLSGYTGKDLFYIDFTETWGNGTDDINFGLGWGNETACLRWNHLFNDKLFSNTSLIYSRYAFNLDQNFNFEEDTSYTNFNFNYLSGIEDIGVKIDFDYIPNPNHYIRFGFSYTNHSFKPGELDLGFYQSFNPSTNIDTTFIFSQRRKANDMFFYIEDDFKIGDKLKINAGLHSSAFSVSDSLYYSFQPRISARYLIKKDWSLKLSYAEMKQNIHLLTNSSAGLPTDIWVPATDSVPPQQSKQIAFVIATKFKDGLYELSLESYYKKMYDLITYKEGSAFTSAQNWETSVETGGQGEAYGFELFLQKQKGSTTGWIGYTLSWTNRQFDNINFGEWYPYKYDRRHDFSLVLSHSFNKNFDLGLTWVYGTGISFNFPQAVYWGLSETDYIPLIESYGSRNSTRMNPYHRLDLGLNFSKKNTKYNFFRTVSFGIYNLYNRKNPFFVYLSEGRGAANGETVARQISLFPIIPSITYNIKF